MKTRNLESASPLQPALPIARPLWLLGTPGLALHELQYPPRLTLPTHAHPGVLVAVALSGGFEERSGRSRLEAGPGAVAFLPPGEPHSNTVGARGLHALRLEVAIDRLASLPGLERREPALVWGRGEWFARALLDEVSLGPDAIPAAVESLAFLLLAELAPRHGASSRHQPAWLRRVRERLEEESTHVPSLTELAREAGVHPTHLARAFARHYSATIGQCVRERRLSLARNLLLSSDTPLVDVAARCGFADQSHLGRAFRRRFGSSPGAFRAGRR